jgi:hypothetical protein
VLAMLLDDWGSCYPSLLNLFLPFEWICESVNRSIMDECVKVTELYGSEVVNQ